MSPSAQQPFDELGFGSGLGPPQAKGSGHCPDRSFAGGFEGVPIVAAQGQSLLEVHVFDPAVDAKRVNRGAGIDQVAGSAINFYEGVVDKYMGDAVTGLFNTQLNPQEDLVRQIITLAEEFLDLLIILLSELLTLQIAGISMLKG